MKNSKNKDKKTYKKPTVTAIKVDSEISMVMMSPPGTPVLYSNPIKFLFK